MPRATFRGVTFDLLVEGLEDRHEGQTTVREVPGGAGHAYVDLGGPLLPRRTVNVLLDNEAQYLQLAALPGTANAAGTLTTDDGDQPAVLLSVTRYFRRGGPLFQLCRTEWVFTDPATTVTAAPTATLPAGPAPAPAAPEAPAP